MANLKDIQRQIKSVKNTQKTTRAMKLVSTAKLRRAEEAARKSRVYAEKLTTVLSEIAYKIEQFKIGGVDSRFFKQNEKIEKVDLIFVTADKGLCGGFNIQTLKKVQNLMQQFKNEKIKVRLKAIGKKGVEYFKFNNVELLDAVSDLSSHPNYEKATKFIGKSVEDFIAGKTDKIVIIHNGYKNMITQEIKVSNLLPISLNSCERPDSTVHSSKSLIDIEPSDDDTVLDNLVTKYVEFSLYFSLIDSLAAEHSARMQAMDSATNNAKELVENLTVKYNKARQEAITTELVEIISGMESMK